MRLRLLVVHLLILACTLTTGATDEKTSIEVAREAVKANLSTRQGRRFESKMAKEFDSKLGPAVAACFQAAGSDKENFLLYVRLAKDGGVAEVLDYPSTRLSSCLKDKLSTDKFSAPPRPDYWIEIQMKRKPK